MNRTTEQRFPKIQGPRIQRSRRHRAAAAFVDEWQVRLIAIGPFYLRLTKRPRWDDRVAEDVATRFLHNPAVLDMERHLE